jgi:RNA polymerase sigma factor (sigma-70 family)
LGSPDTTHANEIIAALLEGKRGVLEHLYDAHRAEFLGWASRRFVSTPNDLEDAWQVAVLAFYENTVSGKLKTLDCTVKTFLFGIGANYLKKSHRKLKRILWKDEIDKSLGSSAVINTIEFDDIWEEERIILQAAMEQLRPNCRELLTQRYYHEKTIPEILEATEYASNNAVSVTLSNCLSALKTIIKEKMKP